MNYDAKQMLDVEPKELRFIFELKKQSTCLLQISNNIDQYVAFKVKTTSPKKYCVRPNVGVILPKSNCEVSVIMQAQKVAPPDMLCKDKFLIQSTVVQLGTAEHDITADMFTKDSGKYIEETKLKVALVSPHQSPVLSAINEGSNQSSSETQVSKDSITSKVEILTPSHMVSDDDVNVDVNSNMSKKEALNPRVSSTDEWGFGLAKHDVLKPKQTETDNGELGVAYAVVSKPKIIEVVDNHNFNLTKDEELKPKNIAVDDKKFRLDKNEVLKQENVEVDKKKLNLDEYEVLKPKNIQVDDQEPNVALDDVLKPRKFESDDQEPSLTKDKELKPEKSRADGPTKNSIIDAELKSHKDLLHWEESHFAKDEDLRSKKDSVDGKPLGRMKDEEALSLKDEEFVNVKEANEIKLVSDLEEMKSKMNLLESKLSKAESTISKLIEEREVSIKQRIGLQEELVGLRSRENLRREERGFPLLFVIMIALVSMLLGYLSSR